MSDVLAPEKTGRGWIIDIPPEMAEAMGAEEGSIIVLYPHEGGMSYEIFPPSRLVCRLLFCRLAQSSKKESYELLC